MNRSNFLKRCAVAVGFIFAPRIFAKPYDPNDFGLNGEQRDAIKWAYLLTIAEVSTIRSNGLSAAALYGSDIPKHISSYERKCVSRAKVLSDLLFIRLRFDPDVKVAAKEIETIIVDRYKASIDELAAMK